MTYAPPVLVLVGLGLAMEYRRPRTLEALRRWDARPALWRRDRAGQWHRDGLATDLELLAAFAAADRWYGADMAGQRASALVQQRERELATASRLELWSMASIGDPREDFDLRIFKSAFKDAVDEGRPRQEAIE